jgi:hypothetical protein
MADESTKLVSLAVEKRETEKYLSPKQSANTLFRFFRKPEYLFEALEKKAIVPRYYGENVDYLNIGYHQVAYPMICFCDITVHRLEEHMNLYGEYGIAFSKSWGINQGIQPLQYINKHSALCSDFSRAFVSSLHTEADSPAADFLLTQMLYMKPIEGTMPRDGKDIAKNFTDECEWRFVPNVTSIGLPQAITDDEIASVGVLNATVKENECCWLKFDFPNVKYIILQTDKDFENLCSVADRVIDDETTKRKLISKIIIWSDAKEDF